MPPFTVLGSEARQSAKVARFPAGATKLAIRRVDYPLPSNVINEPGAAVHPMVRTIALFIFPGVQSLDVSGPLDVFAEANRFLPPSDRYRLEVIGSEHGAIRCSNGLALLAHRHFSESVEDYDLLLAAGGPDLVHHDLGASVHEWLRAAARRARRFGSICNGAFALARAGLLEGRAVTTHWNDAAALADLCPSTRVEADRLFMQDGSLYTSAGVTAGIDLSLFLLTQDHGPEIALNVAKRLVVFTQRAGGQSQFSPYLTLHVESTSPVGQVQQYVLAHLADDLNIAVLAQVANMTCATSRACSSEMRKSPPPGLSKAPESMQRGSCSRTALRH